MERQGETEVEREGGGKGGRRGGRGEVDREGAGRGGERGIDERGIYYCMS